MAERQRFLTSIGASALLHLLLLGALLLFIASPKKPIALPSLEVDLSSLPLPARKAPARAPHGAPAAPKQEAKQEAAPPPVVLPQHQIVDPSDAGEEKVPKETTLLSDRDNSVAEEMVHKGDKGRDENATDGRLAREGGGAAGPEPPQAAAPVPAEPVPPPPVRPKEVPKPVAPKAPPPPKAQAARRDPGDGAERLASLPSLDKLLPSAADMARQNPLPDSTPQSQRSGRDLLNSGGATFSGKPGSRDLLPRVREGNVTMLNTKADLFAPFVRRVAGRVFENLDLAFSSMRYQRGLGSGRAMATVEAVMDRKGRFVSARLTENSGASAVGIDRILLGSATADTFFDANPPPGAEAADGRIHFVLLVDLMVDTVADPRTGRAAVSYYGVAGVGLK